MVSPYKNIKSFDRLSTALNNSFEGLKATFKNEEAFRREIFLALILIPVAFYTGDTTVEKILLVSSLILLIVIELINTGIEVIIDRVSLDKNELSKLAKDVGSAAVLIAFLNCFIVWLMILFF
jgi:diacylglycerol kinase (ATP)|tara:strand:+ start:52 stop:420 length:369 start_codon:yes stop_codon:yes gene_type:complete